MSLSKAERIRREWPLWLAEEKNKINNVGRIASWFLENQQRIMEAASFIKGAWHWTDRDQFKLKTDVFESLSMKFTWNKNCSNSHVAPDGKPTNWGGSGIHGDKLLPTGYPGWTGQLKGSLIRAPKDSASYPYSNAYNLVGIKTGSGGGGNGNHGYGFTVFLEDWPGLYRQFVFEEAFRIETEKMAMNESFKNIVLENHRKYEFEQDEIIRKLNGTHWSIQR